MRRPGNFANDGKGSHKGTFQCVILLKVVEWKGFWLDEHRGDVVRFGTYLGRLIAWLPARLCAISGVSMSAFSLTGSKQNLAPSFSKVLSFSQR